MNDKGRKRPYIHKLAGQWVYTCCWGTVAPTHYHVLVFGGRWEAAVGTALHHVWAMQHDKENA